MKTKSAKKRQAIVDAAAQLFREVGYERTSMADILERVGGSKATLYNHFPSKEVLFFETAFPSIEKESNAVYELLDGPLDDVGRVLVEFGERALELAYSPDVIAARRLTIAEATRFGIGPRGYELGYLPTLRRLAGFMERAMAAGQLRQGDPTLAALQMSALFEAELIQRLLYAVLEPGEDLDIPAKVARAVDAFLAIYRR